jgi:hypothetical protein
MVDTCNLQLALNEHKAGLTVTWDAPCRLMFSARDRCAKSPADALTMASCCSPLGQVALSVACEFAQPTQTSTTVPMT